MPNPLHRQLLSQARQLASRDPNKPKQGNLRRAVSTAYYALFHFLIDQACRKMLGTGNDLRPFRDIAARAFEHQAMMEACKRFSEGTLKKNIQKRLPNNFVVPDEVKNIAQTFRDLHVKRTLADYDPAESFSRYDVLTAIQEVNEAIESFNRVHREPETRFFQMCLLVWNKIESRR